ncbi:MAG: FAD-dependent oxidoreductase [Deltaproteobacteria bacterium]|nr:FAD-dependent oxidoreductase [Deltaproteobacteria bacterium]
MERFLKTNANHDVLIVGSGPIGITAARRLAECGLRVTVLEAGSAITEPPGSHYRNMARFQLEPDSYFAAIDRFLRPITDDAKKGLPGVADSSLLGGQGILWTNNCPRAMDFERWETMAADTWERKYAEAERMLQVISDPAEQSKTGRNVADRLQRALAKEGRCIRGLPLAGRVLESGGLYFNGPWDILEGAAPDVKERVQIHDRVRVSRLHYVDRRVTRVELEDPTSYRGCLDTPMLILAGGAVATPRLLHSSGIKPETLGRGFSFHALLFGQIVLSSGMCPSASVPDVAPRLRIPPTPKSPWHIQILRDTCPLPSSETVDNPHRLVEFQAFLPVEFREKNGVVIAEDGSLYFQFSFSHNDRKRMGAMEADVRRLAGNLGPWRRGCGWPGCRMAPRM